MTRKPNLTDHDLPDPTRPFARFFRRWLKRRGYATPAEAASVLRVSATTAYTWSCGAACIPRTRLATFAPRFGVPASHLARITAAGPKRRPIRRQRAAPGRRLALAGSAAE